MVAIRPLRRRRRPVLAGSAALVPGADRQAGGGCPALSGSGVALSGSVRQ
jgi:hypothetical protein